MDDDLPLRSLLGRLAPEFARRVFVFALDQRQVYDAATWQGAIVVVEHGQIELECLDGSCYSFGRDAVLVLDRLPLRALHNHGPGSTVLVAVARRAGGTEG